MFLKRYDFNVKIRYWKADNIYLTTLASNYKSRKNGVVLSINWFIACDR